MINMRRSHKSAFSLVELLIAFFVLLIGILAVLVLFPLGLRESKTMVDASMAAIEARNARSMMEVETFNYTGDGMTKLGYGTASMIQAKYGPKGSNSGLANFPVMFPWDVLGGNDDSIFPLTSRPIDCATTHRDRVIDVNTPQYSWDARFTVGGGPGLTPPPGFLYSNAAAWQNDYFWWFSQYFKYYAVQISVYRNFQALTVGQGTVWLRAAQKSGGGDYDVTDPNRPLWSEVVVANQPPSEIVVGSAIRIRDDKSDWYKVTGVSYDGSQWHFKLDRPYAGLNLGSATSTSASKTDVIATNTLIDSFTTLLGSQLDDIDSSTSNY